METEKLPETPETPSPEEDATEGVPDEEGDAGAEEDPSAEPAAE